MAYFDVRCVVVLAANHWGKGSTIDKAEAQLKAAGYSDRNVRNKTGLRRVVYLFDCDPAAVTVRPEDGGVRWPKDATAMRVEEQW